MKKEGVEQVIKQAWEEAQTGSNMFKVHRKIANCRVALLKWKNTFQGNSRSKLDGLKKQVLDLQGQDCENKKAATKELKRKLKEAYDEEELFWSKKSRVQWLKEGDKNTHFFHSSVKGRRKRNKMQRLQREDRTWTTSEEEIGEKVVKNSRSFLVAREGPHLRWFWREYHSQYRIT